MLVEDHRFGEIIGSQDAYLIYQHHELSQLEVYWMYRGAAVKNTHR